MSKKIIAAVIAVLVCIVVVLGITNRSAGKAKADGLNIISGGKETTVSWEEIEKSAFEGDLVNGKGETKHHSYEGEELSAVLAKAGVSVAEGSSITVTSEDNYSAELTGSEVLEAGKVYVALTADGEALEGIEGGQGAQLIVFGDSSQKRAVRYMKIVTVE